MKRRPGESILELAARICQDAVTCDFVSIRVPLDEAMRTRFMCSVNNEAVLKALFKVKDSELTFAKAISVAVETEDAAKVAKETVYGSTGKQVVAVNKVQDRFPRNQHRSQPSPLSGEESSRCKAALHVHHKADSPKAHAHVVARRATVPGIVHSRNLFAITARRQVTFSQYVCRKGRTAILYRLSPYGSSG